MFGARQLCFGQPKVLLILRQGTTIDLQNVLNAGFHARDAKPGVQRKEFLLDPRVRLHRGTRLLHPKTKRRKEGRSFTSSRHIEGERFTKCHRDGVQAQTLLDQPALTRLARAFLGLEKLRGFVGGSAAQVELKLHYTVEKWRAFLMKKLGGAMRRSWCVARAKRA
jgi:hypothetical protein